MEVIRGYRNIKPHHRGSVVTIGNFDGVHHGHRLLIAHLVAKGRELGAPTMLITFEPLPREYLQGQQVPARLTRFREKARLLEEIGIDFLLCFPFNQRTRQQPAEWVCEGFLHDLLAVRYVVVGDDFRFGEGRRGNYDMLKAAGDRLGYDVSHIGTLTFDHERVSSTRIREALAQGDLVHAEKLLGRPYAITGRVVYGRQLGRQLGVPTANIRLQRYRAALVGVFAVTVEGLSRPLQGIANIGVRPTVNGKEPMLEVHLFDFEGDVYGQLLKVTFRHKIRDERAFESIGALERQIKQDILDARDWFARQSGAPRS
ncbi:MAG: bifunctional riboflavin kinase/FAD synthetase [Pseudomonadales bacterium]